MHQLVSNGSWASSGHPTGHDWKSEVPAEKRASRYAGVTLTSTREAGVNLSFFSAAVSAAVRQEDEGYLELPLGPRKQPPAQLGAMPEGLSAQQVSVPQPLSLPPSLSPSLLPTLSPSLSSPPSHSLSPTLSPSPSPTPSLLQVLRRLILHSILQSESSYLSSLSRVVQVCAGWSFGGFFSIVTRLLS